MYVKIFFMALLNKWYFHLFCSHPENESRNAYELDPGFMYYFLSAVADVAANPKINASALYFQPNMAYTSSYSGFYNKTLPLFAPRAFRSKYMQSVKIQYDSAIEI